MIYPGDQILVTIECGFCHAKGVEDMTDFYESGGVSVRPEREEQVIKALMGYVNKLVPAGEFHRDCLAFLTKAEQNITEIPDGIRVRQEIALMLGLTPDEGPDHLGEIAAWYAVPKIRAESERMKNTIAELDKLVEEAQIARAQDQQRLFHYEHALCEANMDPRQISPDPPAHTFKPGDRCIYDLGAGRSIPVKVMRITKKRILIRDIGGYGRIRYVTARALTIDPAPSQEN